MRGFRATKLLCGPGMSERNNILSVFCIAKRARILTTSRSLTSKSLMTRPDVHFFGQGTWHDRLFWPSINGRCAADRLRRWHIFHSAAAGGPQRHCARFSTSTPLPRSLARQGNMRQQTDKQAAWHRLSGCVHARANQGPDQAQGCEQLLTAHPACGNRPCPTPAPGYAAACRPGNPGAAVGQTGRAARPCRQWPRPLPCQRCR